MKAILRKTSSRKHFWTALRRWRWYWLGLIMLVGLVIALAILDDYVPMPFNLDLALLILYGLVIPCSTIWVIGALAGSLAERAKSEDDLAQHRSFIQQLEQCQDHQELARFVLKYSATLLPVNHVSLFTYDHPNARLQFTAEWNSGGQLDTPVGRYLASSAVCTACLLTKSSQLRHTGACVTLLGFLGDAQATEYCQPLIYDSLLVGALRFRCKPSATLPQDQIDFFNKIAPQIALALALSLAQPQQLTQAQLEAQIKERRSLAYDLHNSLAQQASYLHLTLERMLHERGVVMADDVRQDLLEMRKVAFDMYEEIRGDLAHLRLQPTPNLVYAINTYAQSVATKANLAIQVATYGEPIALPPVINQQIVSLLREGLKNIEKHALARTALITLTWSFELLTITLADDGVGFDTQVVPEGHYGLALMRERAAELGGELDIDSDYGRGARLTFRFALSLLQSWKLSWPARLIEQYQEP